MDSISIKVPVTIKAKLTEKLKEQILKDLNEGIERAHLEMQQLSLQEARVIKENRPDENTPEGAQELNAIRRHFGTERQKRQDYCNQAEAKKEETEKLAIGAEIVQGTLERQVELKIGDNMREVMNVEVLVEDDRIVAIRS